MTSFHGCHRRCRYRCYRRHYHHDVRAAVSGDPGCLTREIQSSSSSNKWLFLLLLLLCLSVVVPPIPATV